MTKKIKILGTALVLALGLSSPASAIYSPAQVNQAAAQCAMSTQSCGQVIGSLLPQMSPAEQEAFSFDLITRLADLPNSGETIGTVAKTLVTQSLVSGRDSEELLTTAVSFVTRIAEKAAESAYSEAMTRALQTAMNAAVLTATNLITTSYMMDPKYQRTAITTLVDALQTRITETTGEPSVVIGALVSNTLEALAEEPNVTQLGMGNSISSVATLVRPDPGAFYDPVIVTSSTRRPAVNSFDSFAEEPVTLPTDISPI